jgi:DNA-binding transcriptional MerR regulator
LHFSFHSPFSPPLPGTTARVAFLVGAGDPRAADHVAAQGLWLSVGLGLVSAALVGALARPAAVALGGSGEVLTNAVTYLRISALGTPFVLIALVGHGYLRGVQDTRRPMRYIDLMAEGKPHLLTKIANNIGAETRLRYAPSTKFYLADQLVFKALMPIGHFARSAGLSVVALRHYDRVGVLAPAYVDPRTGYRRYRPEQLEKGRAIRRLRDLEVPLEVIREILEAEPEKAGRLLEEHRVRLEAQTWREQRLLHGLRQLIEGKERLMADDARTAANLEPGEQRQLASDLFNVVWSLLETPDRTQQQDDRMLNAAHASRFHWGEVGEPMHFARGEWQLSRVYAVLGRPDHAPVGPGRKGPHRTSRWGPSG